MHVTKYHKGILAVPVMSVILAAAYAGMIFFKHHSSYYPLCMRGFPPRNFLISPVLFRVSEMNCSTFGESQAVYIEVKNNNTERWNLLLKYDPALDDPEPKFFIIRNQVIKIYIPAVSSIYFKTSYWNGYRVETNVGKVFFP